MQREYLEEVWPTTYVTELCLQLTQGSGPWKRRGAPALISQSCERAMLTMGNFTYLNIILLQKRARYERYNLYFVALFHVNLCYRIVSYRIVSGTGHPCTCLQ